MNAHARIRLTRFRLEMSLSCSQVIHNGTSIEPQTYSRMRGEKEDSFQLICHRFWLIRTVWKRMSPLRILRLRILKMIPVQIKCSIQRRRAEIIFGRGLIWCNFDPNFHWQASDGDLSIDSCALNLMRRSNQVDYSINLIVLNIDNRKSFDAL